MTRPSHRQPTVARLLSHDGATTERDLLVTASSTASGLLVRRGVVTERLLTAVLEEALDFEIAATAAIGSYQLDAQNSFLSVPQRSQLDDRGLVREGTILQAGDVLASVLHTPRTVAGAPPPSEDDSRRCGDDWAGMRVVSVEHFVRQGKRPEDRTERVVITVRREADLEVGDVLLHAGRPLGPVAAIVADEHMPSVGRAPADVVLPAAVARRRGISGPRTLSLSRLQRCGLGTVKTRSTGAYSLISHMPLQRDSDQPQVVTLPQVAWLRARGLNAILGELVSLKCDDLENRKAIANPGDDVPAPAAPESLFIFQAELRGLGLNVELHSHTDHVGVRLGPATADEIRSWSHGAVRKPETINFRTQLPEPGGIFDEEIFGKETERRNRRFGHIELPVPIVPYYWRYGSPIALEQLLDLPATTINEIVYCQVHVRRQGSNLVFPVLGTPVEPGEEDLGIGAVALSALLREVPIKKLPPALVGRVESLAHTVIPVIPADYRPLVLLDSGNYATSDLNDLYRRIINRAFRLAKLRELNAPDTILWNEQRMLQQTVDALYMNAFLPRQGRVLGSGNRPLKDLLSMVLERVRTAEKPVDWCGRARPVVLPDVDGSRVRVPRQMFERLRLQCDRPVLLTLLRDPRGMFGGLLPEPHDLYCFGLASATARRLHLAAGSARSCVLHRPLTRAAIEETRRLLQDTPPSRRSPRRGSQWTDAPESETALQGLIVAALTGVEVHLDTPGGLLLAGTGSLDIPNKQMQDRTS